jgi:hypothetical protein
LEDGPDGDDGWTGDAETSAMEEQLEELLDKAVARRDVLARLLSSAEANGKQPQLADVQFKLAELDRAIVFVTDGVTKH